MLPRHRRIEHPWEPFDFFNVDPRGICQLHFTYQRILCSHQELPMWKMNE